MTAFMLPIVVLILTTQSWSSGFVRVQLEEDCLPSTDTYKLVCTTNGTSSMLWKHGTVDSLASDDVLLSADYQVDYDDSSAVRKSVLTVDDGVTDRYTDTYYCIVGTDQVAVNLLQEDCTCVDRTLGSGILQNITINEETPPNSADPCGGLEIKRDGTMNFKLDLTCGLCRFNVSVVITLGAVTTTETKSYDCTDQTPVDIDKDLKDNTEPLTVKVTVAGDSIQPFETEPLKACPPPPGTTTTEDPTTIVADDSTTTEDTTSDATTTAASEDITGTASDGVANTVTDDATTSASESDPPSPEGSESSTPKGSEVSSPEGQDPTEETSSTAEPSGGTDWKLIIVLSITLAVTITGAIICTVVLMLRNEQKTIKLYWNN